MSNSTRANENIFVKSSGDSWFVMSPNWEVPCVNEHAAFQIKEIIEAAYEAGADDLREDFYDLITPSRILNPNNRLVT